jgi:hypothetical protein
MKMNLLGLAAIAVAISASAFTTSAKATHKKASGLYWFSISGANRTPSQDVPEADAVFIEQSETAPVKSCSGSSYQCVSGFNQSQVNTSTDQLDGTQAPADVSQTRN